MRKRQIFIELTSLLDIILILIFLVVMQSHQTVNAVKDEAAIESQAAAQQVEELRGTILERDEEIASLQEAQAGLEADIEALKEEKASLQGDIESLQEELAALREEREALLAEIEQLKAERDALLAERDELAEERDALKSLVESLQERAEDLEAGIKEAEAARDQAVLERDILFHKIISDNAVLENTDVLSVSVEQLDHLLLDVPEEEDVILIQYDWDAPAYARNRLKTRIMESLRATEKEAVFVIFQYRRNDIYRMAYRMITDVITECRYEAGEEGIRFNYIEQDIQGKEVPDDGTGEAGLE
ncbi:MAG: hypothetical protein J6U26_00790 [Lachnospiraceae bacterium]|nr:hypothetical protein [Lachnospiraceae bacterium]